MKNFYKGGRELCYLKRLSHLFKSNNNRSRTLFSFVLSLICVLFSDAQAQSARTLGGVVRSAADGQILEGVSIYTDKGGEKTSTDRQGKFSLRVGAATGILHIRHIGFTEQSIAYDETTAVLEIGLQPAENQIEEVEVVSTGYQQIPKERATGSFVHIDTETLRLRNTTNILESLEGTSVGLQYDNRTGTSRINIRGINTFNDLSQGPLIVVDNFPFSGDISQININDVESVTLLKDAAATSIWGVRAGNGVLVINLKKAKVSDHLSVQINHRAILNEKRGLMRLPNMSSSDFIEMERLLFEKGFYDSKLNAVNKKQFIFSPAVQSLQQYRTGAISIAELEDVLTDLGNHDYRKELMDYFYRKPLSNQTNINLSRGGSRMGYNLGVMYQKDSPEDIFSQSQRVNLRLSNQFNIGPKFTIQSTILLNSSWENLRQHGMGYGFSPGGGLSGIYPYVRLVAEDGKGAEVPHSYNMDYLNTLLDGKLLDWKYRPYEEHQHNSLKANTDYVNTNLQIRYKFFDGFSATLIHGFEKQIGTSRLINDVESFYTRNLINRFSQVQGDQVKYIIPMGGIVTASSNSILANRLRGQLNLDRSYGKHYITAMTGGELNDNPIRTSTHRNYGFDPEVLTTAKVDYVNSYPVFDGLSSNSNIPYQDSYALRNNRILSFYGNAGYTYNMKYTLFGSIRKDGSNNFGAESNHKWNPLWSGGVSWNLDKESFIMKSRFVDRLQLKATLGHSGNIGAGALARTVLIHSSNNPWTSLPFAQISLPPNPQLKWEDVRMMNLGIDFSLFSNSFSGSMEYFTKLSTDLISADPIDPTTGLATAQRNVGKLKGKGMDVSLSYRQDGEVWSFSTTLNVSYVKDEVLEYRGNLLSSVNYMGSKGESLRPVEGKRLYPLYSYRFEGLDPETGDPLGLLAGAQSKDWAALVRDSLQNVVYHGTSLPPYYGNFTIRLGFKNISLQSNLMFKWGHYFRKNTINYTSAFSYNTYHEDFALRWRSPGDESNTFIPSMNYPANSNRDNFFNYSDVLVHRGDLIRLKDIALRYLWTPNIKQDRKSKIEFGLSCSNIGLLWRANKAGIDPDYNILPPSRSYSFTISLIY
ncbi:SusC/RagA family TonB-linked outer membrane protein [Sphingobacterium lumbrici]|uniref:SusC/RagA family TonB-linked outer membrane protein n=1 Tax=Sphingobacterium lumbrici TaxID=2559600 RepID=UPI00112BF1A7|nr:SusC/RagA family TonB-linked outer membrane protein [Sphingobacterium lumbrici]